MSRSAHTFLPKNKLVAGMGIGAIAMLAMAGPALTDDNEHGNSSKKDEMFKVTTVMQVPGAASFFSFDISWFDPKLKKFFLADRNNKAIDVVDQNDVGGGVTQFPNPGFAGFSGNNDTSGPDGVLTANNSTELWVGDSPGKVWVMDATTGAIKTKSQMNGQDNPILVKTTGTPPVNTSTTRADELCYDPKDNIIMIASPAEPASNGGPFVTFISTKTYKVLGHLTLDQGTGIEQCGWSPKTGKFYQNVPADPGGQDQVAVIDPKTMKVDRFIKIDACKGVRGLAIGPDNQILIGCTAPSSDGHRNSVVIDDGGAVLKVLQDLGGVDEVWFNPDDGHYILPSCNTPCRTVPVMGATTGPELLGIVDSSGFRLDHSVTIARQNTATAVTGGNPRTTHSAAAGGNVIFLPIPATGGTAPQFDPTLCDSLDDTIVVGSPNAATGCIAILKAKPDKDDRSRVAHERDRDDRQD
jgi:hypothetical protein